MWKLLRRLKLFKSPLTSLFQRGGVVLCVTLLLGGCSLFSPVETPNKTYLLNPSMGKVRFAHSKDGVILISTPTANPGYDTENMVYTKTRYELKHFAEHSWVAPPTQMLAPLLVQSLQQSGCFKTAAMAPYSGETNYVLNTQLVTLQQEFQDEGSDVRLVMEATLVDNLSHEIIAHRRFQAVVPACQNTPYAGVIAANQAVANVLTQIVRFTCTHK